MSQARAPTVRCSPEELQGLGGESPSGRLLEGMGPPWAPKEESEEGQRITGAPAWAVAGQRTEGVSGGREYSLTYV